MQNTQLLENMNKVYFKNLKARVENKLQMQDQPVNYQIKEDIKSEIAGIISINTIMADFILQSQIQEVKVEDYYQKIKDDIIQATKEISKLFTKHVEERVEKQGYANLEEYKQALYSEIQASIKTLKAENTVEKESDEELEK